MSIFIIIIGTLLVFSSGLTTAFEKLFLLAITCFSCILIIFLEKFRNQHNLKQVKKTSEKSFQMKREKTEHNKCTNKKVRNFLFLFFIMPFFYFAYTLENAFLFDILSNIIGLEDELDKNPNIEKITLLLNRILIVIVGIRISSILSKLYSEPDRSKHGNKIKENEKGF